MTQEGLRSLRFISGRASRPEHTRDATLVVPGLWPEFLPRLVATATPAATGVVCRLDHRGLWTAPAQRAQRPLDAHPAAGRSLLARSSSEGGDHRVAPSPASVDRQHVSGRPPHAGDGDHVRHHTRTGRGVLRCGRRRTGHAGDPAAAGHPGSFISIPDDTQAALQFGHFASPPSGLAHHGTNPTRHQLDRPAFSTQKPLDDIVISHACRCSIVSA